MSSAIHKLLARQILSKSSRNFFSYPANILTERQTDKRRSKQYLRQPMAKLMTNYNSALTLALLQNLKVIRR